MCFLCAAMVASSAFLFSILVLVVHVDGVPPPPPPQAAKLKAITVTALIFCKDIDASFVMGRLIIKMLMYYQPVILKCQVNNLQKQQNC